VLILQVHAYALLGTSVHENHTFLAVVLAPLLIGVWTHARALLAATSGYLFLALFFAAGLGRRVTKLRTIEWVRAATLLDASVVVAAGHIVLVAVLLVWIARTRPDVAPTR
jgi:biotin transporter BioY